jgi:hypothetical protein
MWKFIIMIIYYFTFVMLLKCLLFVTEKAGNIFAFALDSGPKPLTEHRVHYLILIGCVFNRL